MDVVRINGVKIDLDSLSNEALGALLSTVKARQRRAERDAGRLLEVVGRRTYEETLPYDAA